MSVQMLAAARQFSCAASPRPRLDASEWLRTEVCQVACSLPTATGFWTQLHVAICHRSAVFRGL